MDGGGDDGGLDVAAGRTERPMHLLERRPFEEFPRVDAVQEFADGAAQSER